MTLDLAEKITVAGPFTYAIINKKNDLNSQYPIFDMGL
jgi:hypothetical protein